MYLGTFESACDPSELRKLGINYILNCAYDCKNTQLPKSITELHLKIRDAENKRWEVPEKDVLDKDYILQSPSLSF